MVNGFKKETEELSDYEKTLIPILVVGLKVRVGKEKSITNKLICEGLGGVVSNKITPARVRKLIHYIRCNKLVTNLIATSKGYYRAETKEELDKYREGLNQRINSIMEVEKSFN